MTHIAAVDRSSALATYGPGNDHPMIERLKRFVSGAGVPPAVQAEIIAELSALPEGSPDYEVALGNLRLIRRVLAQPALTP